MYKLCVFLLIFFLVGCGLRPDLAPVMELKWRPQNLHQTGHKVLRGETLYAIAFRYDQDYRRLATLNHLHSPYALRIGQIIQLQKGSQAPVRYYVNSTKSVYTARYTTSAKPVRPSPHAAARIIPVRYPSWLWPVHGRVVTQFIPQQGKKGIDIAGRKGEKIRAASNGMVAYAGNGLSGYGNLIIIKHNNQFLTAYGHNLRNIVREGQPVKAGQVIAEMGVIDRRFWGVHFEIRKAGRPVNPLNYLQKG
jgi:lipoprotein NlpD